MLEISAVTKTITDAVAPMECNIEMSETDHEMTIRLTGPNGERYTAIQDNEVHSLRNIGVLIGLIESLREVIRRKGIVLALDDKTVQKMIGE